MPNSTIRFFTSSSNNKQYLALAVRQIDIIPFQDLLQTCQTSWQFARLLRRRNARDGYRKFHITVVNPKEIDTVAPAQVASLIGRRVKFSMSGVGRCCCAVISNVVKGECELSVARPSELFYAVVKASMLDAIRANLGLEPADFHSTLGFYYGDNFKIRKNKASLFLRKGGRKMRGGKRQAPRKRHSKIRKNCCLTST